MGMMVHTCSHSTWRAELQNKPLCVSPLHPIQSSVHFLVYFMYIASIGFINHTWVPPQYFCSGVLDENQDFVFPPVTSPVFLKLPLQYFMFFFFCFHFLFSESCCYSSVFLQTHFLVCEELSYLEFFTHRSIHCFDISHIVDYHLSYPPATLLQLWLWPPSPFVCPSFSFVTVSSHFRFVLFCVYLWCMNICLCIF